MKKSWKAIASGCLVAALCVTSPAMTQAFVRKEETWEEPEEKEAVVASYSNAMMEKNQIVMLTAENTDEDFQIEDGKLVKYNGNDEEVIIPDGVTVIGDMAFRSNRQIRRVVIPEGVTEIGGYAFQGCSKLESVEFPKSLVGLGQAAFFQCEKLTEITITNNWETFFEQEHDITNVTSAINTIGPFRFCDGLKTVNIDKGVTKIPEYLFENCDGLEKVNLKGITEISRYAFHGCDKLTEIEFNSEKVQLGVNTFRNCKSLEEITLPGDVSVIIAEEEIMEGPFNRCENLTKVNWNGGTSIPAFLFYGCGIKSFDFSGIEEIGDYAFCNCADLTGQADGDNEEELGIIDIKKIRDNAFEMCRSLKTIVLGENLNEMGEYVFRYCEGLKEVYIYSKSLNAAQNSFDFIRTESSVIVYGFTGTPTYQYFKTFYTGEEIQFKSLGGGGFTLRKDSWSMDNDSIRGDGEKVPYESYVNVLGKAKASDFKNEKYGGYCYGFSRTAALFFEDPELFHNKFGNFNNLYEIKDKETKFLLSNGKEAKVIDLLEYFYISQFRPDASKRWAYDGEKRYKNTKADKELFDQRSSEEIQEIIDRLEKGEICEITLWHSVFAVVGTLSSSSDNHAILAYEIKNIEPLDGVEEAKVAYIYNCNKPDDTTQSLLFLKIDGLWKWSFGYTNRETGKRENYDRGYQIPGKEWDVIVLVRPEEKYSMDDFGHWYKGETEKDVSDIPNMVDTKGNNCEIKNTTADIEFKYIDEYPSSWSIAVAAANAVDGGGNGKTYSNLYYIPNDEYIFRNPQDQKGLDFSFYSYYAVADIYAPGAATGTVSLNDETVEENKVILDRMKGNGAQVSLAYYNENTAFDKVTVTGKGIDDQVTYTLKAEGDGLKVEGVALEKVQVTFNEDTEEERIIDLPVEDNGGASRIITLSEADGKTIVQVKDENAQVIASSDDNNGETDEPSEGAPGQGGGNKPSEGNDSSVEGDGSVSGSGGSGGSSNGSGSGNGGSSGGSSSGGRRSGSGSSSVSPASITITLPSYIGTGTWKANAVETAWWLEKADGTYPASQWGLVDGVWYLFGGGGYTYSEWQMVNGSWYYFEPNAMMKTGWIQLDNKWYFLEESGAMKTGWLLWEEKWYYLGTDGAMLTGMVTPDGYQVGADGVWVQ